MGMKMSLNTICCPTSVSGCTTGACPLIGQVRLEGPQTQDVQRPITLLADTDNPVLLLSSFSPHLSHGELC